MKYILLSIFIFSVIVWGVSAVPDIACWWLPGCGGEIDDDGIYGVLGNIISLMIQYIAVLAVLAVMLGGIMYLVSSWDEEKTKRAKNVIIWALVGVFLSVAAWSIIGILNNFRI